MKRNVTAANDRGQMAAVVALGFLAVGTAGWLLVLGIVLGYPEVLAGDPTRVEVLALLTLIALGFIAPIIFGGFYGVSSLLSSTGLWSRRSALVHLGLHLLGLGWAAVACGGMVFLEHGLDRILLGGTVVLVGMLLMVVNLLLTASRHNRWEPAQISVITALFWMMVLGVFSASMLGDFGIEAILPDPISKLQGLLYLGVAGCLVLSLFGIILKQAEMFEVGSRPPGVLAWAGLGLINGTLLLAAPMVLYQENPWWLVLTGALLVGGALGWLDLLRMVRGSGRLFSFGIMAPFSFGTGVRLVPFLVWRIRCAPLVGHLKVPMASTLGRFDASLPAGICTVAGIAYLVAGWLKVDNAGAQLGALCLLVGTFWYIYAIMPAVRMMVFGIEPQSVEAARTDPLPNPDLS